MVLEGLDNVEVGSLSLGDTILSVKLELSGDDGVLSPAVHVEGGLGEDECAGIRHIGSSGGSTVLVEGAGCVPVLGGSSSTGNKAVKSTGHLEDVSGDESVGAGCLGGASEDVDGVGEGIDGVGVVERLGSQSLVESGAGNQRTAVIDVGIRLDNPHQFLAGVVKIELNLVRAGTNGLITSELELSDQVLMGVLCHSSALISVKEDIVNIERSSNQRLIVGNGSRDRASNGV